MPGEARSTGTFKRMATMLVGYARCSTDDQDLTAQRNSLEALGVKPERTYVDHGLTGTNRARPGLLEALAACHAGDTLVVTKLDRLARSLTDARNIVEELTAAEVKLNIGGSVHDPSDPIGRLLFNVLAMIAEFESDLIRMRTREGMKVAKAKADCAGSNPSSNPRKRPTSSICGAAASTPPPSWPTCSTWAAPPSTGPCNAPEDPRQSVRQGADTFPLREPGSIAAGDSTVTSSPTRRTARWRCSFSWARACGASVGSPGSRWWQGSGVERAATPR
jgi:predicted site-specific integrase-resolvase